MTKIVSRLLDSEDVEILSTHNFLFKLKDSRILITGGTGMIGSYLIEAICFGMQRLGIAPKEIRIFSGSMNFDSINHLGQFEFIELHKVPLLEIDIQRDYDFLIHAASPASPTKFPNFQILESVNSEIFEKLISRGMQNVLFVSTGEVYGPHAEIPCAESADTKFSEKNVRNDYPRAKLLGEIRGNELSLALGAKFNVARLFHSFGPGMRQDDGRSFSDFIWKAARFELPVLRSAGNDIRTFLYLRDTVLAFFQILDEGENGDVYNVGSSSPISILDCAKKISDSAGLKGAILFDKTDSNYIHSPNHAIVPDVTKLSKLGWKQDVEIDEMIFRTLRWARRST